MARKRISVEEASRRKEKVSLDHIRPQVRKSYEKVKKERKGLIKALANI